MSLGTFKKRMGKKMKTDLQYFLSLETYNFVNKTNPSPVINEGCCINNQEQIRLEAKNFFNDFYSKTIP